MKKIQKEERTNEKANEEAHSKMKSPLILRKREKRLSDINLKEIKSEKLINLKGLNNYNNNNNYINFNKAKAPGNKFLEKLNLELITRKPLRNSMSDINHLNLNSYSNSYISENNYQSIRSIERNSSLKSKQTKANMRPTFIEVKRRYKRMTGWHEKT